MPAIVDDINDLSCRKIHNDKCIFFSVTDIQIYFIYWYVFRQRKSGKIYITLKYQTCSWIRNIELSSNLSCWFSKSLECIKNQIWSDIWRMRVFIQKREGIILRMTTFLTHPSTLSYYQVSIHWILGDRMIYFSNIYTLGMHTRLTHRTKSRF